VPSRREGQLLFIGTELEPGAPRPPANELFTEQVPFLGIEVLPGEVAPESQIVTVTVEGQVKRYRPLKEDDTREPARLWVGTVTRQLRRLHENDPVKKGQLLASLDPSLAIDDLAIKYARLLASQADWQAAQATRAAAVQRLRTARELYRSRAVSKEELSAAEQEVIRYRFEEDNKRQTVELAKRELNQARTILGMHEIRSKVDGVIRSILKKPGEAVKNLEPVFQVHNPRRLRVEGMAAVEHLPRLQALKEKGQRLVVEPARLIPPRDELSGHLLEVTSVAVSKDLAHPLVVSGSEDGTVRVWDLTTRRERWIFRHGVPVRAVACTPPGAPSHLCLAGTADGAGVLWDLESGQKVGELAGRHTGPINSVAFSPDGKGCVTGGDDQTIRLWHSADGRLRYRFPTIHRDRITSLQLTRDGRLLSAAADATLLLWKVGPERAELAARPFERRSGDVPVLGISADGGRLLFDVGKEVRVLSLPEKQTDGVLRRLSGTTGFTTLALFAPDGRTILTAAASEPRLQLWNAPDGYTRPHEVCQLVWKGLPASCAAFAPDGSFLVTGMKDRQVVVWPMPAAEEVGEQPKAEITLVEPYQASGSSQVRIWAEIDNPKGRLLPGSSAILTAYP
jgi:WD40 repeat protein